MANMKLIQAVTVGAGGAASMEFTSIPSTYTDLLVKVSARTNRAAPVDGVNIAFNGSTSNFTGRYLESDGSSAYSGTSTRIAASAVGNTATASTFGNSDIYIPNYTSSNNKSFSGDTVTENNATPALADLIAGLWSNSAAITSIALTPLIGTTFDQYSTAYLYGVSNTIASGAKATGGYVTEDNNYWYHTFLSSEIFTPNQSLTCDYLVVAGGGGGSAAGGGGAGGYRTSLGGTPLSLTAQAYSITVGAGGTGNPAQAPAKGTNGSNSVFSSITSTGGGAGGGANGTSGNAVGNNGGSGGGAGYTNNSNAENGGSGNSGGYSPVEGYAGGNRSAMVGYAAGGGGGAGGAGGSATTTEQGGNGGIGSNSASSFATATNTGINGYYAGGGGGGTSTAGYGLGGLGGGGNGGGYTTPSQTAVIQATAGFVNTGSGGGAMLSGTTAVNGGSGIVIVRYAK